MRAHPTPHFLNFVANKALVPFDPSVTQASPKGDPGVTQGSPRRHPIPDPNPIPSRQRVTKWSQALARSQQLRS